MFRNCQWLQSSFVKVTNQAMTQNKSEQTYWVSRGMATSPSLPTYKVGSFAVQSNAGKKKCGVLCFKLLLRIRLESINAQEYLTVASVSRWSRNFLESKKSTNHWEKHKAALQHFAWHKTQVAQPPRMNNVKMFL